MLGVPYQKHSEPSREAAVAMTTAQKSMETKVLDIIKGKEDGQTDEEVYFTIQQSGLVWTKESTVRARRVRLVELGLVRPMMRDATTFATRKTRSGRNAQVWVAA
jgi:hypothetical protein